MKLWPWNEWDGFCLLLVWPARTPSQAPKQAECQPEEEDNEIKASIVVRGRSGVCQRPAAGREGGGVPVPRQLRPKSRQSLADDHLVCLQLTAGHRHEKRLLARKAVVEGADADAGHSAIALVESPARLPAQESEQFASKVNSVVSRRRGVRRNFSHSTNSLAFTKRLTAPAPQTE
jgi:hypothetical protein